MVVVYVWLYKIKREYCTVCAEEKEDCLKRFRTDKKRYIVETSAESLNEIKKMDVKKLLRVIKAEELMLRKGCR